MVVLFPFWIGLLRLSEVKWLVQGYMVEEPVFEISSLLFFHIFPSACFCPAENLDPNFCLLSQWVRLEKQLLLLLLSHFSRVRLSATPWTAAHQAPPSMGFSRGEDWSGVLLPSLGDTALSSNKTWDWKQETEPCFPMYLLGSPICCVNLIKFHHLSGGVKVGVSLQEVRMVLLWGDGEHPLLVVLTFHFCSKHQVQL